jgi:hypothetical protein
VIGDDLAALLYLATSHADPFVRCACAARALELRGMPVTEAAVARAAKVDDRALAGDVAGWLTETKPLRYRSRHGRVRVANEPHAARLHALTGVCEGMLDLGPYGLHRAPLRG